MSIALPRIINGFQRLQSEPPPIHWPSAILGLSVAVTIVVGVTWVASIRRPEARAVSAARTAAVQQAAAAPEAAEAPQPAVAPTPIPPPTVHEAVGAAERVKVVNTRGLGVNLRAAAGERAPRIKTLPEGAQLEAIGPEQQADGLAWRNVKDQTGASGWVAATFISRQ